MSAKPHHNTTFPIALFIILSITVIISILFETPSAQAHTAPTQLTHSATQAQAKRVRGRPRILGALGSR